MKHIHVAAAVMIQECKVFAAQRKDSGELGLKWEFPGGKLEPGESGENAIVREIMEELSTTIVVDRHFMTVNHQYDSFRITMDAYLCTIIDGSLSIGEHVDFRWLSPHELYTVDWAEADIPIVDAIARMLGD